MVTVEQPCYTLLNLPSYADPPNEMQLKMDLEKGEIKVKIEALKKTIHMIVSGERLPGLLMTIIRFVLPLQDHTIKKLLLIFWEIVPKTTPDGKLMQEMILVCDSYRKEPELLEPLMPAIRACLDHRHSYVRRNAVLAIFTIYRSRIRPPMPLNLAELQQKIEYAVTGINHQMLVLVSRELYRINVCRFTNGEHFLIPDAPELIASFLEGEQDMSCKRNAFLMLLHADQERALAYLASCLDQVKSFGDILQLVIVELIYKVCHANPSERSRFIRCIYNLLNSTSQAVRYEAAGTLVTLSSAPTAIKAAASCYIELIVKESDNNVKLIVLDRLIALKEHPTHERVLQDLVMDILRVLASPDLEVRKKTLNLAMELVSSRNIEEMVLVLKKEVAKTHNVVEHEDTGKYRQLLVRTLHSCCIKFPDVAATVIPVLIEFLSDTNELAASDVLRLLDAFPTIKSVKVHRAALWILGEYATSPDDIQAVMNQVRQTLGEIPLVDDEIRRATGEKVEEDTTQQQAPVQKLVTSDAALGTTLAKLALRYMSLTSDSKKQNRFCSEAMLIMASILHLGKSGLATKNMTNDDADRLYLCLRVLSDKSPVIVNIFNENCRRALSIMLAAKAEEEASTQKAKEKPGSVVQADDPISFLQLSSTRGGELGGTENVFELSLNQAVVGGRRDGIGSGLSATGEMTPGLSKLNKVTQLTGFSDPVYAEAYVHVNQYDIVLDVLIVNQTGDTLQNCTLELATLGDLKLVEKPQPVVLAPRDFCNIKANVKVASTENGIIFGNIVYDVSGAASDRNVVVLNDIHIDIMDYIVPATCNDTEFRQITNMKCLTPEKALSGQCGFMAANMYARSIFGEDALANLSIEKPFNKPDAPGMALSLGDKMNMTQKGPQKTGGA
ncbi:Coatomer subunit beta [Blattella germanica]|nr:Coatomer subunit beta [Blattella germanica]